MSLSLRHKRLFPEIDTRKMMDDDPNNLAKNRTNNCQSSHQHQIAPEPMLDENFCHTLNPTVH